MFVKNVFKRQTFLPEIREFIMSKGGIQTILHGIMRYRTDWQRNMLQHFKRVRDNPNPTAVFVTCVDSRMLPSRFTQTNVGDMFIIRNAGNMVPHR